jgi:hypothetical protein
MIRIGPLAAFLAMLAACAFGPPSARYTGPAPPCAPGEGTTSTLMRTGNAVAFAPTDGALVVQGLLGPTGSFAGSMAVRAANVATPGAAAPKPSGNVHILSIAGVLTPDQASVTYTAPGCQAKVILARAHSPLL